jgi:beta-lactam-binding protein with PASTA domain
MFVLVALALAVAAAILGLTRPWDEGSARSGGSSTNPSGSGTTEGTPAPSRLTTPGLIGSGIVRARRLIAEQARRDGVDAPDLRVIARRYSESAREGVIVSQAPRPGRQISPNAEVKVVTSKGTAFAAVPEVTSRDTLLTARQRLAQSDFRSDFRYAPSWDVARSHIISVTPASGTRARRPGPVKLIASSGPPMARVPELVGDSLEDAQDALRQTGLRWTTTTRNSTKPDGTVLDQSPAGGDQVIVGTTVRLVVSHRPVWSTVHRFSGGANAEQSPPLTLGARWRIRWTLVGLGATAVVSWRAPDGFEDVEQIDSFSDNGVIDPETGAGTFSIKNRAQRPFVLERG